MTSTSSRARRACVASMAVLMYVLAPRPGFAQDSIPSLFERTGTLRSPRLREVSGVAVSRRRPGVLWVHNDSGDGPTIYAVNPAGDLLAIYHVAGAAAEDWEDIALGPCPAEPRACLYLADTGDNAEKRKTAVIYVVPEPELPEVRAVGETLQTSPAHGLRLRYPDRPHDVEALFVDRDGNATLITKGRTPAILRYTIGRNAFLGDTTTALLTDTLPITPQLTLGRLVTGAAIAPSGKRVVVRTYSELYFFRRSNNGKLTLDGLPCWIGAAEPQGEGVDFLDEDTVVLTSESLPGQLGPIHRVRCSRSRAKRST